MNQPDQVRVPSLRVELASCRDSERLMHAAVRLAKVLDTQLEAVFTQDPLLLEAAGLPFVEEICLWTAKTQLTSSTRLARSMRIQARQMQTLLARIAHREAVAYSFASAEEGQAHQESAPHISWVAGHGLSSQPGLQAVCAIDSRDTMGEASIIQAAELARKTNRPLRIYTLGGRAGSSASDTGQVSVPAGISYECTDFRYKDICTWLAQARKESCYAIFIPEMVCSREEAKRLPVNLPFPVLLVA